MNNFLQFDEFCNKPPVFLRMDSNWEFAIIYNRPVYKSYLFRFSIDGAVKSILSILLMKQNVFFFLNVFFTLE